MARQKCIASLPGDDNVKESLTVDEETQRDMEDADDVASKTPESITTQKEIEAALLLARAVDLTFLDGHWITFKALAGAAIVTGVVAIDAAVADPDAAAGRIAFDTFFRDQVKARL